MRPTRLTALLSLFLLLGIQPAPADDDEGEPAGIRFLHDLEQGRRIAKETGRPLVLYFTFDT